MIESISSFMAFIVFGIMLAVPYCILAGWNTNQFALMAFVAPLLYSMWISIAYAFGIAEPSKKRPKICWRAAFHSDSLFMFWPCTGYVFLPIIVHQNSKLFSLFGYNSVAQVMEEHKYASLLYAFPVMLVVGFIMRLKEKV